MNRNKYYPKSYKEKTISTPHESGRKELSTKNKDSISKAWNQHNTDDETIEYTLKENINGAFGNSAFDAEQEIYDTIDYKFGSKNISPDLMEALEYYEEHEEPNQTERITQLAKNHKSQEETTNQYDDYDEDFYKKRKNNKLNKKNINREKLEEKYIDLEEEFEHRPNRNNKKEKELKSDYHGMRKRTKAQKNTKNRNAKSKKKHNRSYKTERKNSLQIQKDIEKYSFSV